MFLGYQVADHLLLAPYGEVDLDSTPVVVLGCKHVFTAETLDGHMGVSDVYDLDAQGACPAFRCACMPADHSHGWICSVSSTTE